MNRYQDWLAQAERDLQRAAIDIKYEYWEWACFTAQQAAEKAVKALLMHQGYSAWGHSITPMLRNLETLNVPTALIEKAQSLDAYYIPTRYPNGFAEGKPADYYNESQAREAVDAATEIIRFCKTHITESK
ncbi:HEPN domain-containing protein [Litorilinea aerophila]|uniref:HEPN domain-containing protein n=1 Tax=Litorilinea aerophila TaxID=1204385 RepID=A0A540V8B6_9CHLR|nr:HEPN domain-containing protein [Litorilinea aerophila]MCC9079039.1 HEPN domain-containing protein [Litorilinea aerophila]OUC07949.1 DNA-binding protein [Litorilinea aerophila]GIV79523.1 MAG: DNA-binding protein [Litorilinea sp.]